MRVSTDFAVMVCTRDIGGGLWLWGLGVLDATRMLASAGRRRSKLRLRVALAKLHGLAIGTFRGLGHDW